MGKPVSVEVAHFLLGIVGVIAATLHYLTHSLKHKIIIIIIIIIFSNSSYFKNML
jgi:hypothetical protein